MQENKMQVLNILNIVCALWRRCLEYWRVVPWNSPGSKGMSFQLYLEWLVVFVTLAVENEDIWLKKKGASGDYLKANNSLHVTSVQ